MITCGKQYPIFLYRTGYTSTYLVPLREGVKYV